MVPCSVKPVNSPVTGVNVRIASSICIMLGVLVVAHMDPGILRILNSDGS